MTKPPRTLLYLILLGAGLLTLAIVVRSGMFARKDPGQPINSAMREALEKGPQALSAEDAAVIAQRFPEATKTPSGLMYVQRATGTGLVKPQRGQFLTAHYDGKLLDGTPFDSSYRRSEPLQFRVGMRAVIPGWDEAFLDMRVGEKRTLIIPYWLGYGLTGKPPTIPPRATLVFEVELLGIR